tara:strand:- start:533 stop:895 length:363 start_codon:yes stop_codon:yes gene_type:complete
MKIFGRKAGEKLKQKKLDASVRSQQAAEFRAKKKADRLAAIKAQKDRAAANTYKKSEKLGTAKKPAKAKVSLNKDTRSKAGIASGNKRAIANRKAKANAKAGGTYTYTSADGTKKKVKKK